MGADISSERGYTARQATEFEQRYREVYGENLSREELLERYRMEKLKAEQKRRSEQTRPAGNRDYSEGGDYSRRKRRSRSEDRDERHVSGRRQDDNLQIIKTTYERSRRSDHRVAHEDRNENRHHRSRRHNDHNRHDKERKSRRRSSRDRSGRSSSESSTKENRRKRDRSREMLSSDRRHSPNSDGDKRSSSRKSKSSPNRSNDRHKTSRSERKQQHYSPASNHRSSRRERDESNSSEDEKRKRESKKETIKEKKKQKSSTKENTAIKIRDKKKKKSAKAQHHKSAPDLTETNRNRQYGKGPWERTHSYFDDYSHRPQSWVQELAQGRSATIPAPFMERQIIYSVPEASAKMVDGLGYPLKEKSPGFQPVLYETYLMQKPSRPLSLDMSYQQPQVFSSPVSLVRSPNTSVKFPAGAVPAVGPRYSGPTSLPIVSEAVVPQRSFEVQAHMRHTNASSTLPSQYRSENSSVRPMYRKPPQYASSTLTRSDAPTPRPRTKSPTKEQKFFSKEPRKRSTSPKRHYVEKQHTSKITATSAREDFETLLSLEYDMKPIGGEFSTEFPPTFPGNYRANQEIFVDDVIFRKQPEVKDDAGSMTDSDVITDDEHVLILGVEPSPNSVGYSSGYDLDIPVGFCFDSEGTGMSSVKKKNKPEITKKLRGHSKSQQETRITRRAAKNYRASPQDQLSAQKHSKTKALVLTTIEPVSRPDMKKTPSRDKPASPKRRTLDKKDIKKGQINAKEPKTRRSTRDQSTSPARERDIHPTKVSLQKSAARKDGKKFKNRKIQHPSKDESYQRIIIPSQKWKPKLESKKTHDIGVGTKTKLQKSTGIQTEKPRQPTAQPIYFLKPISAQEIFIEDSVTSKSETDFSQTQESSEPSSESNPSRSAASWSRSSTVSSRPEYTDPSEVESAMQNLERNSKFFASNEKNREPSITSSVTSFDSEKPVSLGPSMVLGVSESIQASSYTGKGGKVFCLTRSKAGSPPPMSRTHTEDDGNMDGHIQRNSYENGQIEPSIEGPIMHYEMGEQLEQQPVPQNNEHKQFEAHEVGKWVLDCYAQDQKLVTTRSTSQDLPPSVKGSLDYNASVPTTHAQLTKQPAVEFEGSFQIEFGEDASPKPSEIPKVVPLTREALSKHEKYPGFHRSRSQEDESGTELSANVTSELSVFQKELIKTRQRIQKTREKTPEPEWKTEQYKAQLKQWNASPSSNVVLAEVCSVNDEDLDLPPKGKEIHPSTRAQFLAREKHTESEDTDDATSQSTRSSESSDEGTSPRENGTQSLNALHQSHPKHESYPQLQPTMLQKSDTQLGGLNKDFARNHGTRPSSGIKIVAQPDPGEDWRIVGAPKHPHLTSRHHVKDFNDNLQQDPIVPRAEMLRKYTDSVLNMNPTYPLSKKEDLPDLQPLKMRTSSLDSDTTSCPGPITNPFNKMDQEEINSLVEKIPGRGSVEKTEAEMDILEKLEKSRKESTRESLEERTARILGIYRRVSSEDEEETYDSSKGKQTEHLNAPPPAVPVTSSNDSKRDVNAYMNILLTGVSDVSPGSRQKYFLGEMAKHEHVTSPLATTSTSSKSSVSSAAHQGKEKLKLKETKQPEISESSDDTSSDEATITETYSVNVSDSVLEASVDCKVKLGDKESDPRTPPKEYKIPDDTRPPKPREELVSPKGGMMLSYGNNIYAETPGFHRKQQSFDSTESDEPELQPLDKVHQKLNLPQMTQESLLPISATSPPLTEKEIGIVKDLVQNHSRTASQGSINGIQSAPPNKQREPPNSLPIEPNRNSPASTSSSRSWNPSREHARDKIAKSIGFTLQERKSSAKPDTNQPTAFSPDEYDIKILSFDRKRVAPQAQTAQQDHRPLDGDKGSLENVMESVGLDPNEAWLLSV